MKKNLLYSIALGTILILSAQACKSKTKTTASTTTTAPAAGNANSDTKTTGKVSHAYGTCGTVIVIPSITGADPMILIAVGLPAELDVEGLEISFHYHPLKRKNPDGCRAGFPASITDATKKQ
ncbi:MAG: hypothetical protein ACHQRM_01120 [Bacteroidia bacterium]